MATGFFIRESHLLRRTLTALVVLTSAACSEPTCCIDNYPVAYALIYGTVRLGSQSPAPNTLVHAGDGLQARTDAAGRYRLLVTSHAVSVGTWPLDVTVFRSDSQGRLVDSSMVEVQVPFATTQPPRDSVQVNFVVPWSQ